MPVCTNCAYPAEYVYTTYKTKSNIRLGVCSQCDQFLDPLIEHPNLVILLDMILLKPRVFLHLLFNRGSPPFDADKVNRRAIDKVNSRARDEAQDRAEGNSQCKDKDKYKSEEEDGVALKLEPISNSEEERHRMRRKTITDDLWKLFAVSLIAETALRTLPMITPGLTQISSPEPSAGRTHGEDYGRPHRIELGSSPSLALLLEPIVGTIARTAMIVFTESVTQHAISLSLALLTLRWKGWYPLPGERSVSGDPQEGDTSEGSEERDGRRRNFIPALIPLTILYTSLLPLLLQMFLSIWYTPPSPTTTANSIPPSSSALLSTLHANLPSYLQHLIPPIPAEMLHLERALHQAWARSDKIWTGTKLLGGMSAGFGLRVLLPTRPWETTGIILAGWASAALVANLLGGERGGTVVR